jgi:hypothetical protein
VLLLILCYNINEHEHKFSYDVERRLTPRSKDNKMVEYDELMNCITTTTMAAQCGETSSMGSTRARSVSPNELQKINRSENRLSITNSPRPQDLGSGKYRRTSLTRDERQTTNSTEDEQL